MDKDRILESCIKTQEEKIKSLEGSLNTARREAIEAPGHNVSHSDTSKFQQSNLALGLEQRLMEAKNALRLLKTIPRDHFGFVRVGSFFTLEDVETNEKSNYLLVIGGGGEKFDIDGETVTSISNSAPLAKAVIGKEIGDEIEFRGKNLGIVDVQ